MYEANLSPNHLVQFRGTDAQAMLRKDDMGVHPTANLAPTQYEHAAHWAISKVHSSVTI